MLDSAPLAADSRSFSRGTTLRPGVSLSTAQARFSRSTHPSLSAITSAVTSRAPTFTALAFRLRLRFCQTDSFRRIKSVSINPLPQGIHCVMLSALSIVTALRKAQLILCRNDLSAAFLPKPYKLNCTVSRLMWLSNLYFSLRGRTNMSETLAGSVFRPSRRNCDQSVSMPCVRITARSQSSSLAWSRPT